MGLLHHTRQYGSFPDVDVSADSSRKGDVILNQGQKDKYISTWITANLSLKLPLLNERAANTFSQFYLFISFSILEALVSECTITIIDTFIMKYLHVATFTKY